MNPTHFDFELIDHVGHVILNRPTRLNALTFESYAELRDFFASYEESPDVQSIVIRGEGRAFCSGAMLKISSVSFSVTCVVCLSLRE